METLTRFLEKFQQAYVIVNLESQFSLTFNGYKNVKQYTNEIGKSEMALLEEYGRHMESPCKEYWKKVYHDYLSLCEKYFSFDADNTLQNIKLEIKIKGGDDTGKLPEAMLAMIQEFLFVQYNSLHRVLNCMGYNSYVYPSCFQWNGKVVELLEYLIYPYMIQKIIPRNKEASQIKWIKCIFMMLNVQIPNNLYQFMHKLFLREDPFRFLHNMEANARIILEEG